MIAAFVGKIPVVGVCLGHQSIVQQQGGEIVRAERLMHGKTSFIKHDGKTVFEGISQPFEVGRYHSLCADTESLPDPGRRNHDPEPGLASRHLRSSSSGPGAAI